MSNRDSNGRFVKGHKASVGNKGGRPPKKREERFYEIALRACTFKDWRAIVKKAVEQAKGGDTAARKFLADYLMGPPAQRHEITGAGGGPLAVKGYTILAHPDMWQGNGSEPDNEG